MDLFSEMQTALQSDLNVSSTSSLFPLATIKSTLNRAYIKVGRLFRWPALEDAKMTSTQEDQEYYDAPATWSPDSIWKLEVDDEMYGEDPDGSPMAFEDYLIWKEDNENSTEKKWAVQHLRYFIYPIPTAAGSNNISVWGQENVETLTENGDTTIFSYNMPECNEAIVLEAGAMLKRKGEAEKSWEMLSGEAKQILIIAFGKIKQEQAKFEKVKPFLNVPDYFGPGVIKQNTGNFD